MVTVFSKVIKNAQLMMVKKSEVEEVLIITCTTVALLDALKKQPKPETMINYFSTFRFELD